MPQTDAKNICFTCNARNEHYENRSITYLINIGRFVLSAFTSFICYEFVHFDQNPLIDLHTILWPIIKSNNKSLCLELPMFFFSSIRTIEWFFSTDFESFYSLLFTFKCFWLPFSLLIRGLIDEISFSLVSWFNFRFAINNELVKIFFCQNDEARFWSAHLISHWWLNSILKVDEWSQFSWP